MVGTLAIAFAVTDHSKAKQFEIQTSKCSVFQCSVFKPSLYTKSPIVTAPTRESNRLMWSRFLWLNFHEISWVILDKKLHYKPVISAQK